MKKLNHKGFALMEVLVLILIILIFLTSLLGTARFRHHIAMNRIQKEEAAYAAKATVELMAAEIQNGAFELGENGLDKISTRLEFEAEDRAERVLIPVTVWAKRDGEMVTVYAEAQVNGRKEMASITAACMQGGLTATGSNTILATPSEALECQ